MRESRKSREVGSSLMVAVPSHLAELIDLKADDVLEFDVIGRDALRVTKVYG